MSYTKFVDCELVLACQLKHGNLCHKAICHNKQIRNILAGALNRVMGGLNIFLNTTLCLQYT